MIEIAIVEDEEKDVKILRSYIERYGVEKNILFKITSFPSADAFLFDYKKHFDIVFMDIMMPGQDGMEAAKRLREIDSVTLLIFCTTISQMAHRGYEVEALDYILKPVEYPSFTIKLDRAIRKLNKHTGASITVKTSDGLVIVKTEDIQYLEVQDHILIYHTEKGDYKTYQSLKSAMQALPEQLFFKCNNCYLVNLSYVQKIFGFDLYINNKCIQISHPRKSAFVKALQSYLMGEKKI